MLHETRDDDSDQLKLSLSKDYVEAWGGRNERKGRRVVGGWGRDVVCVVVVVTYLKVVNYGCDEKGEYLELAARNLVIQYWLTRIIISLDQNNRAEITNTRIERYGGPEIFAAVAL